MVLTLVPFSDPVGEARRYAETLAEAMTPHLADRISAIQIADAPTDRTDEQELVHWIIPSSPEAPFAPHPSGSPIFAVSLLPLAYEVIDNERRQVLPDCVQWIRPQLIFCTSEDDANCLYHAIDNGAEVHIVSPWAPEPPADLSPIGPAPFVLCMITRDTPPDLAEEMVRAADELPPSVRLVAACEGGEDGEPATLARRYAAERHVEHRVEIVTPDRADEIAGLALGAEASVVGSPRVAGPWHGFLPLGCGRPLLAPALPIFRDVMLDGHCIRLVRAEERGHVGACLRALLSNPIGVAELRERSAAYARSRTASAAAQAILQAYRSTLT